ncbi:MAG: TetR/AcrR family transcriptional regulator [Bacteroidales bacterium]|nr:TetR/AcrR family transcriptional regulator [Bacteroidales bacterium]
MENKIINTAMTVFIEKGYAETSMSEIAARVGINRPALHYYFRTKDKMFEAVFGDIILSIVPKIFDILIQRDKKIGVRIEEIVDTYYTLLLENPKLPMFIIREINRDVNLLINTVTKLNLPNRFIEALDSIQEEMNEGKLKNVPIRFVFYNLYGLLSMPFLSQDLTHRLLLQDNENFEEMLEEWKPYIISQMENLLKVEE